MRVFNSVAEVMQEAARIPLFARWQPKGKMPLFSRNHQTGKTEAGLSVNGLSGRDEWTVAQNIREYQAISGGKLMLVTGREVGTGSDGEPVIVDVEIVGSGSRKLLDDAEKKDIAGKCAYYQSLWLSSRKTNNAALHALKAHGCRYE